jgi:hypothetical protein
VRDCFKRRPPSPIGAGLARIRTRLRQIIAKDAALPPQERRHRLLQRIEFYRLCDEEGCISDKEALLDFLHQSGVIFYRNWLFGNRIVLDQIWALEAIYALFDVKKRRRWLTPAYRKRQNDGISATGLDALVSRLWIELSVSYQKPKKLSSRRSAPRS